MAEPLMKCVEISHFSAHVTSVLFLVRFNNFATTGLLLELSYMLLL